MVYPIKADTHSARTSFAHALRKHSEEEVAAIVTLAASQRFDPSLSIRDADLWDVMGRLAREDLARRKEESAQRRLAHEAQVALYAHGHRSARDLVALALEASPRVA